MFAVITQSYAAPPEMPPPFCFAPPVTVRLETIDPLVNSKMRRVVFPSPPVTIVPSCESVRPRIVTSVDFGFRKDSADIAPLAIFERS